MSDSSSDSGSRPDLSDAAVHRDFRPEGGDVEATPIAVVGMAAWYPGASDLAEFWENVVARRRAFRRFPEQRLGEDYRSSDPDDPDRTYVHRGGFIDGFRFDWVGHRIPRQMYEGADIAHWLAYEVALRAFADGGYDRENLPRAATGVIVGNTLTGEQSRAKGLRLRWPFVVRSLRAASRALGYSRGAANQLLAVTEDVYKSVFPQVTEDTLPGMLSNTIAGQVCNMLDLRGGAYTVDGACASSLIAIGQAADALADHRMDLALAGGVDVSLDPFELVGFARIGALAREDMYVYERRSQGFYPGEGCGWVLLKRLEDAERDGDYVYAVLRGWGMSSDGRGGITAPGVDGQALAVRRAYERAGYRLADVDFVEGHGTGTVVGDRTELTALGRVLESEGAPRPIGITSLKAMIGHCKAAAGVASFIKAVLAVNQRVVPPLPGCERPHEAFDDVALYPLLEGERRDPDGRMRAGVSSFGFGGINVHATVESAGSPADALRCSIDERALFASTQESELYCFAAASAGELRSRLEPLVSEAGRLSFGELTDLAAHLARSPGDGPIRAAVVAGDPDELARKLATLSHMLEAPPEAGDVRVDAADEVWLSAGAQQCRVGFLFPGQGAQRVNMSRLLVERHGWARDLVATADAAVGEVCGDSLSGALFRPLHQASRAEAAVWQDHLRQTQVCQPAVCLASVLYAERLRRLGMVPTAVGGHSLGELTAFWAAGALDLPELLVLARVRGESMAQPEGQGGTMAGLSCSPAEAEALCERAGGYVVVANRNSDRQTVVSGDREAVEAVMGLAAAEGVAASHLPVSGAFHSRHVAGAGQRLADHPLAETVPELSARLFTGVDGREITPGGPLRAHLARQVTEQVDFVSLAATVAGHTDLLVEVGPGQALSRFVADVAAADGRRCLPVEVRPGESRSLNRLLAAFHVSGGDLDLEAVVEDRLARPYVEPSQRIFVENPCEHPFAEPEVPSTFDQAPKGVFESLLPERTGYDGATLETYLERRGGFLADVIRADLGAAPLDAGLPTPASAAPAPSGAVATGARPSTEPATNGQAAAVAQGEAAPQADVEDLLIDLVVERTGFPRESIRPEMQLLNDLNLESIAATEVLTRAAAMAGVSDVLDVSTLVEASLREAAEAIRAASGTPGQPSATPGPASAPAPVVGPADHSGLLDTLERITGRSTWLRAFHVRLTDEPLAGDGPGGASGASDRPAVTVAAEDDRAGELAAAFAAAGCQGSATTFADLENRDAPGGGVLVALLPATAPGQDLESAVRRFVVCLRAAASAAGADGTLVLVQAGGGYFGTRPDLLAGLPLSAGAFAASLHHERPALRIRVVDVADGVPADVLVARVLDELGGDEAFVRAGYDCDGARRVPRPFVAATRSGAPRPAPLGPGDVVLCTGGAKGITAELALAVGQRTGARMVLLGRSDPADGDAAETLRRFGAAGVDCRYVRCDVSDAGSVEDAVRTVGTDVGAITAVLHGAGVNRLARVGTESLEEALAVIAPKVHGLAHVLATLPEAPRLIVALSSIIGVTGMPGNAWYALANEGLDRLVEAYGHSSPGTEVLSVAYSLWDGTGMARLEGVTEGLRRMGTSAIEVDEATEAFLDLLSEDPGTSHVVLTGRIGGLDTWCPDRMKVPRRRFLSDVVTVQPGVELVARVHLSLDEDPYLRDHVYKGTYLFPMVFGLEAMAQATAAVLGRSHLPYVRLEDVELPQPIAVDPRDRAELLVHVEVAPPRPGSDETVVRAGIACRNTGFRADHFSATFVLPPSLSEEHHVFDRPDRPLPIEPGRDLYGRFLFHGPAFQRLRQFFVLRSDYAVFTVRHEPDGETAGYVLGDPFFRDALLQAGQVVISQDRALPRRIGRIEVHQPDGPPREPLVVEGVLNLKTDELVDCTITVTDPDGRVVQRLDNCVFSIVERLPDEPTAEEIVDPDRRDQRLLEQLAGMVSGLGIRLPALAVANLPRAGGGADGDGGEEALARRAVQAWSAAQAAGQVADG